MPSELVRKLFELSKETFETISASPPWLQELIIGMTYEVFL
jgi:hypothetical protein